VRLAAVIGAWAIERELADAVEHLVAAGVPAAGCTDPRTVSAHPHFAARGFFEQCAHPVVGSHPVMGLPYRWNGVERWIKGPAPTLGEHNAEILSTVLGLSEAEIDDLAERGVIGDRPLGA
jgi:crotonobetainyl-CoA:carnitine CoA-transferase CaiB-like acyl-CoA transferase